MCQRLTEKNVIISHENLSKIEYGSPFFQELEGNHDFFEWFTQKRDQICSETLRDRA